MELDTLHELTPFGNPDGSRASIDEVTKGFVTFGNPALWGGLSTPAQDLTARIIAGRKGSGKTVYLRRLQAHASENKSLFADAIQQDLPTTQEIIKFCQLFPDDTLTENWMVLWRRAVLLSLASHILCNKHLANNVTLESKKRLLEGFKELVRGFSAHVSVYSQVSEIINAHHSKASAERFLSKPLWPELETVVADILATCPPVCLYLDAVDEEFAHAPMYWLRCQKGLFYQTMRLLRDSQLGSRLHVVICIRDTVLSSVYRSEHQTRYRKEPHIRVLSWNRKAVQYFLDEKLRQLPDKHFLGDLTKGKSLTTWVGMNEIWNEEREVKEPLGRYLLRHTRLLPRDVVILGNALCEAIARHPQETNGDLQKTIRRCVASVAKGFGDEQLAICANEWASSSMPAHAVKHGYSEVYTGNKEYSKGVVDDFKSLISFIGTDRFGQQKLQEAQKWGEKIFGNESDPFEILWINGLIGYVDGGRSEERHIFHTETSNDDFHLPANRQTYVFHPIVVDSVRIKVSGNRPVVPFDEE